jgi:DNA-binding NtrC family response regulator
MDDDKQRVLLVDDDPAIRKLMGIMLEKEGLHCTRAENSEVALRCLKNSLFHLLIIDKNLPGLDGLQLARIVHMISPDLPILMITGYASEESAREAAALGIGEYIRKPIDIDVARQVVSSLLPQGSPSASRAQKQFESTFPPGTLSAVLLRMSEPRRVLVRGDETAGSVLVRGVSFVIIEQDDDSRRKLLEVLGPTECQVDGFETIVEAQAHVQQQGYDVLIGRPEVLIAAKELADQCPSPPLGSIAIMEQSELDHLIEAIRLGARGVIAPPFPASDVYLELARVMQGLTDERTARVLASGASS